MIWLAIWIAGAIGATCRYLVDHVVSASVAGASGWGTWTVNVTGSLLVGAIAGVAASTGGGPGWRVVAAGGFCGGYTTFSTWMYEVAKMAEERAWWSVAVHLASLAVGVTAVAVGWWLASLVR